MTSRFGREKDQLRLRKSPQNKQQGIRTRTVPTATTIPSRRGVAGTHTIMDAVEFEALGTDEQEVHRKGLTLDEMRHENEALRGQVARLQALLERKESMENHDDDDQDNHDNDSDQQRLTRSSKRISQRRQPKLGTNQTTNESIAGGGRDDDDDDDIDGAARRGDTGEADQNLRSVGTLDSAESSEMSTDHPDIEKGPLLANPPDKADTKPLIGKGGDKANFERRKKGLDEIEEEEEDEQDGVMEKRKEPVSHENMPFCRAIYDRGGWLVGLLVLQSMSSFIIKRNEGLLQQHGAIVQFLTMLVGAGGNAGNQASVGGESMSQLIQASCRSIEERASRVGPSDIRTNTRTIAQKGTTSVPTSFVLSHRIVLLMFVDILYATHKYTNAQT